MTETIFTPTVMWGLLIAYVISCFIYLFVLKEDIVPLFISIVIAIPIWIYAPKIEGHYQAKALQRTTVIFTEPAGTTTGGSHNSGLVAQTSFETENAVYRVYGNHTIHKGAAMYIQGRADGSRFLCSSPSMDDCMQIAE